MKAVNMVVFISLALTLVLATDWYVVSLNDCIAIDILFLTPLTLTKIALDMRFS